MSQCGSCNHVNEPGTTFCLNCGSKLEAMAPSAPVRAVGAVQVGGFERRVYFKLARVIAWMLLIPSLLAMVIAAVGLVSGLIGTHAGVEGVSVKQVKAALESAKSGGQPLGGVRGPDLAGMERELAQFFDEIRGAQAELSEEPSSREVLELDRAIYDLADTLSAEARTTFGGNADNFRDNFRNFVKPMLGNAGVRAIDDQVELLEDAAEVAPKLSDSERVAGIQWYFALVGQSRLAADVERAKAMAQAGASAVVMLGSAVLLMVVTMTLVLLSIERNTRGEAE